MRAGRRRPRSATCPAAGRATPASPAAQAAAAATNQAWKVSTATGRPLSRSRPWSARRAGSSRTRVVRADAAQPKLADALLDAGLHRPLGEPAGEAVAHLAGRGAGEGDGEDAGAARRRRAAAGRCATPASRSCPSRRRPRPRRSSPGRRRWRRTIRRDPLAVDPQGRAFAHRRSSPVPSARPCTSACQSSRRQRPRTSHHSHTEPSPSARSAAPPRRCA